MRRTLFIAAAAVIAAPLSAQTRAVLPEGTVILVRTQTALESANAKTGQTFQTVVSDSVVADNYTLIPAGSTVRGVIAYARVASRSQSGVIDVHFDRLTLPDGRSYAMEGKLTSTDAAERKQIDADSTNHVVLIGGRGGIGAAIAGTGSDKTGILSALGSLLSEGRDVAVPAGTQIAVQLTRPLTLSRRGYASIAGIFTATDRIRAAQTALARANYYRGPVNGLFNDATQRALVEYQIDNNLTATGNLDVVTAQKLGIYSATSTGEVESAYVLTSNEAAIVRRAAQSLASQERVDLRIATTGRLSSGRSYTDADLETWFAISAFADNASIYEALVRPGNNTSAAQMAGKALITAARRVDAAIALGAASSTVRNNWASLRSNLSVLDPNYR